MSGRAERAGNPTNNSVLVLILTLAEIVTPSLGWILRKVPCTSGSGLRPSTASTRDWSPLRKCGYDK